MLLGMLGFTGFIRLIYQFSFNSFNYIPTQENWVDFDNIYRLWGYYYFCGISAVSMGSLFSDERSKKTFNFLFIHPLTRTQIWVSKVYFGILIILSSFIFVAVLHRLFGAWWVWGDAKLIPVYPYSLYIAFAGFALGLLISICLDNNTTGQITTVLGLVLLYFGFQYFGKIDWQDILPLFVPISVIFITISHLIFCSPDYWDESARKIWYRKVAFIAGLSFFISWIPFFISSSFR